MKNLKVNHIVLSVLALFLVFGFTSCKDESELEVKLFIQGTWQATSVTGEISDDEGDGVSGTEGDPDWSITFNDDTYTVEGDAVIDSDGTYTVEGDDITLKPDNGIETTWKVKDISLDYMRATYESGSASVEIEFDKD
ncbi:lipocalin family protein [Reichenbachiella agarivorans]|uniref:Lipocalin family protein n=1 Tax=Reichenbachiella agarivorans TaxID=2979464 RepID=A0ABY6CJC9_9BACT|nr:lipocalin family protein [Reichenbachiella agarivorans]UXP30632.1 lipocalin family protein [Reichenbachiella agarivorans]